MHFFFRNGTFWILTFIVQVAADPAQMAQCLAAVANAPNWTYRRGAKSDQLVCATDRHRAKLRVSLWRIREHLKIRKKKKKLKVLFVERKKMENEHHFYEFRAGTLYVRVLTGVTKTFWKYDAPEIVHWNVIAVMILHRNVPYFKPSLDKRNWYFPITVDPFFTDNRNFHLGCRIASIKALQSRSGKWNEPQIN